MRLRSPNMGSTRRGFARRGYTLVEMLIVVVIVSIVATVAIPAMSSAPAAGLKSAGRVLASDLRLASELAVQFGTEYTVDFDVARNRFQLRHTGTASPPPLKNPQAPPGTQDETYLVELGPFGGNGTNPNGLRLKRVELKTSDQSVTNITFGPLGGTGPSRTDDTEIWLERGTGGQSEYLRLNVSAVTGQVWLDQPATYPSN
jgi:prepilin-type N-terminal cleavage/methylation domain-containing protein